MHRDRVDGRKRNVSVVAAPDVTATAARYQIARIVVGLVVILVVYLQSAAVFGFRDAAPLTPIAVTLADGQLDAPREARAVRQRTDAAAPAMCLCAALPHSAARLQGVFLSKKWIVLTVKFSTQIGLTNTLACLWSVSPSARCLVDATVLSQSRHLPRGQLLGGECLASVNLACAWIRAAGVPRCMAAAEQSRAGRGVRFARVVATRVDRLP